MDHAHDHLQDDHPDARQNRHGDASDPDRSANPVCYHQNCPVCGRNLRIRVLLLGRRVYCQHCGGGFIATDARVGDAPLPVTNQRRSAIVDELIERAAVLLALAPQESQEPCHRHGGQDWSRPDGE